MAASSFSGKSVRRRDFLSASLAGGLVAASGIRRPARADSGNPTNAELRQETAEWRARAIAAFPYERIEVPGLEAYATWRRLKDSGRGSPAVLGDDDDVAFMMERFASRAGTGEEYLTAAELEAPTRWRLDRADKVRHPGDLLRLRAAQKAKSDATLRKMLEGIDPAPLDRLLGEAIKDPNTLADDALLDALTSEVPTGRWPKQEPEPTPDDQGVTVARIDSRTPLERVHIAIFPTDDWTEVPAYVNWGGGWRSPTCEYHVAALRSWRERYGAELVGLDLNSMNVCVAGQPATRDEALALAREQYIYSPEIVFPSGLGTLAALAAVLATDRWWLFWWD